MKKKNLTVEHLMKEYGMSKGSAETVVREYPTWKDRKVYTFQCLGDIYYFAGLSKKQVEQTQLKICKSVDYLGPFEILDPVEMYELIKGRGKAKFED